MPFMRAHSITKSRGNEPWLQAPIIRKFIHDSLDLRYQLFHYFYTEFYLSSKSGQAIWKPLWQVYPDREELWDVGT